MSAIFGMFCFPYRIGRLVVRNPVSEMSPHKDSRGSIPVPHRLGGQAGEAASAVHVRAGIWTTLAGGGLKPCKTQNVPERLAECGLGIGGH